MAPQAAVGAPKAREAAEASIEHVSLTRAAGPAKGRRPATRKKAGVLSQPDVLPFDMLMEPSAPARAGLSEDMPNSMASRLSAWLAAVGLEEIEPMLIESGVLLLEDLQCLAKARRMDGCI